LEQEKRDAVAKRRVEAEERKERKAKEQEERRQLREEQKTARAEKRKAEEEKKQEKNRRREEKRRRKESSVVDVAAIRAAMYECDVCKERGKKDDERNGITWYGCDECDLWFHDDCLSVRELVSVVVSLNEGSDWFCKGCRPWLYEE